MRRSIVRRFAWRGAVRILLAVGLLAAAPAPAQVVASRTAATAERAAPATVIHRVDAVGMTVSDVDQAVAFYTAVLDFEKLSEVEVTGSEIERLTGVFGVRARIVRLRLGEETIELTQFLAPEGRPIPADSRSQDRWFQHIAIIVSDMDRAYARLRAHKVRHASSGPQRLPDWNAAAAGIEAFYFKDPDGHTLEILAFPPGKGAAKWHRSDRLFLGIDHTAIVVADTDRSLTFYRDLLGFAVAGESENHGPEQERLNSVFGARLRITTLRAPAGPAVELLEYLAPRDGRPYPSDARANDLLHWQTTLVAASAPQAAAALRTAGAAFISPGVVAFPGRALGFTQGFLVRDPDGHAMEVVER